jgi:hypothetical protein
MLRVQESPLHYYQRPDAPQVSLDPLATSLSGWGGRLNVAKQKGSSLFLFSLGALSPGFDPNDAGFQHSGSDVINMSFLPGYQWTKPGKVFQQVIVAAGVFRNYDFGGNKTADGVIALSEGMFHNFWRYNIMGSVNPETLSNRLTRGGPLALMPWGYEVEGFLETDGRKPIVLEGEGFVSRRPEDGTEWQSGVSLSWRPRSNLSFSIGPQYGGETTRIQYIRSVTDPLMTSTYGARYVFGRLDQKVIAAELRLNWTFTPRLTLQAYIQPFQAVGKFDEFKELAQPRTYDYNIYGQGGSTIVSAGDIYAVDPDGSGPAAPFAFANPDFNMKSLRGTVVLRWEYLPGSLLYFVWTQNRADYAHPGDFQFRRDFSDLLTAPGDNIFLIKVSYRWNM